MTKEAYKILIIDDKASGIALAKYLKKLNGNNNIFIAPANGILSDSYEIVDIRQDNPTGLLKFALEKEIDITIPISELAIKSDIVEMFQQNGQNIFGPTKDAAKITTSKISGKKFLYKIHAQTSKFANFDKYQMAENYLTTANFPLTIKTDEYTNIDDRLVCPNIILAKEFLHNIYTKGDNNVLIEEFIYGHNFTVYYITDGYTALPINSAANYKFSENGDGGILTNGIGCYIPDYKINETVISRISKIVQNTITELEKKRTPYLGILGIDCTLTDDDKFIVNEFRPFFQDIDCHAILSTLGGNIINLFDACIQGLFSDEYEEIKTNNYQAISIITQAKKDNAHITGLEKLENIDNIDFINCKKDSLDKFYTKTGNTFVMTKIASTLSVAKENLYDELSQIKFDGMKYRTDICK